MTTVLPITPRTPSSLLAALALSPVLAPLNSETTLSLPSLHLSASPSMSQIHLSPASPSPPLLLKQAPPPPTTISPPEPTRINSHTHRVISLHEAHQLTVLIIQHFYPVRASSKGMMKASIELAEYFDQSGFRWDRHRRVMGMHLRGIWEEGARLLGGIDRIGDLSLEEQGVFDLYVQGSFLSVAEENHPIESDPHAITGLATVPNMTETLQDIEVIGLDDDFMALSPLTIRFPEMPPVQSARPATRSERLDPAVKDPIIWRKRMNNALRVHIDKKRMAAAQATQPMSALSALSMMSVTELKWALLKRMRYRISRAIGKAPRSARRMHFGGWEMR